MKKATNVLLLWLFVLIAWNASAQLNGYTFSSTVGNYTEITGGTLLGTETNDDQRFVDPAAPAGGTVLTGVGFPIGFTFKFDGVDFDRLAINANGWVSLGQSTLTPSVNIGTTSAYTPIGSTTLITPDLLVSRVVGFARDLQAQVGATLRLETIGAAPNRVCVIQWKNYRKYNNTGDNLNFQIRLNETSNTIQFVYGTMTNNATSTTVQVGLRGAPSATATNYANRSTTTNWAATDAGASVTASCTLSNTVYPVSGTTFTYTPPVQGAPGMPSNPSPIAGAVNVPINGNLTWTFGLNTVSYDLWFGPTGSPVKVVDNVTAGPTGSYTYSGLTNLTGYEWHVVARNGALETIGPTWTFTTITAAPLAATNPSPAAGSVNVPVNGQLTWTFGAQTESYDLMFGLPGAMTKVVDNATAGTTGTYDYSGLTYTTLYNWQVISRNSAMDLVTEGPVWTFTTECNSTSVPYTEDFETAVVPAMPLCTSTQNAGQGNNWITASAPGSGFTTKALKYGYNSIYAANAWFFTNGINLNAGVNYRLSFNYGNNSTTYIEKLKVAYGSSADYSAMTTVLLDFPNINQNALQSAAVLFTPVVTGIYYFGFNAYSDIDQFNLYVDNISIIEFVAGNLDGYVYQSGSTNPIEGATVTAGANTTTTNAAGFYQFTDILAGTYDMTASAPGYITQNVNGIVVNVGQTTHQDFSLTWAQIGVNPTSFTETLEPDATLTKTLSISNTGTGNLNWTASVDYLTDKTAVQVNVPSFNNKIEHSVPNTGLAPKPENPETLPSQPNTLFPDGSMAFGQEAVGDLFVNFDINNVTGMSTVGTYTLGNFVTGMAFPPNVNTFTYAFIYGTLTLYTVERATGAMTALGTVTGGPATGFQSITVDPTSGIYYGTGEGNLYSINPAALTATLIGAHVNATTMIGIACDGSGNLYGFDVGQDFSYMINKTTGIATALGAIGFDANYAQTMFWDQATDAILLGAFNNTNFYCEIRALDKVTGATTILSSVYYKEMTAAAIPYVTESWLQLSQTSGTVPPGQSVNVDVVFNSEDLSNITKTANININSNSQTSKTSTLVPVTMNVVAITEPPALPSNPNPANNATMVPLQPTLTWTNGARTTDVRLTLSKGLAVVYESDYFVGNSIDLADVPITLDPKAAYRWRLTPRNSVGTTLGPQWNFTTIGVGTISGTVIDTFSGLPIEGATVTVDAPAKYAGVTGVDGTYSIPGILEGTYTVSVTHPDYVAPAPATGVVVTHNATTTVDFSMDLVLDPPLGLEASIFDNYNVHLTWDAPGTFEPTWIHWDDGVNFEAIGLTEGGTFSVASRWTPAELAPYNGKSLTKIAFYNNDGAATYTLQVWKGPSQAALTLVHSQPVTVFTPVAWNEITLTTPIAIDGTQEFWFGYETTHAANQFPAGCDAGPAIANYGDMIYFSGAWSALSVIAPTLNYNWNLQGLVEAADNASAGTPVAMTKTTAQSGTLVASNRPPMANAAFHKGSSAKAPTGYNVYRDNAVIASNVADLAYDDLDLAPGTYAYEVAAIYPQGESAKAGPVNVTIVLGGWLEGYVYDVYDNSPIEGAVVETVLAEYSTTTNALGYFYMALPAGLWDVAASATGYGTLVSYGLEILANETLFNDYGLTLSAPVLTDVYQDGMYAVVLWDGNPLYENAKDKSNLNISTSSFAETNKKGSSGKPRYINPGTRQGGDDIANAVAITTFPYTVTGTTDGFNDDYDVVCPYESMSPDVVYSYVPAENQAVTIGLCNSEYDTKLFVFAADGVTVIACNEDACGDDGWKSQISNLALVGGETYYIVVDGYDDTSYGNYELTLDTYVACDIDCSPTATAEDEVCAGDDYVDTYNGGCNSNPPVFSYISSGQTICGTASTYVIDGLNRRDTDWYLYTTEVPQSITFSGVAEFPLQLLLVGDLGGCETFVPAYATATACEIASFTYEIGPGTWYLWVGPSVFEGVPCDAVGNQYEVELTTVDVFLPHYNVFRNNEYLATTYNTYFVDPDINLGDTYCYQVSEVVTEAGRETGLSNTLCVDVVCPAPIDLYAEVTGTSADLFWTPMGFETSWNLEWGPAGFTPGTGTLVNVTAIPYTLTGLTEGSSYAFYVQADCGSGYASTWTGPATFTVPCLAAPLPYTMDFTGVATGTLPACWSVSGLGLTNWSVQATANAGGVSPEMRLNWSPSFTGESMLVSQPVNTTGYTTLSMTFKHYLDWYSNSVVIGVKTTADGVTWNEVWSVVAAANIGPEDISLTINNTDVGSSTFQVAFFLNGYTFDIDYWYIDNVLISAPITCPAPTLLTATDITQTSATLGWTPGGSETFWNLEYGTAGFTQGTGTFAFANLDPSYLLSGLDPSTAYSFYVQAVCGEGDNSFWSGPYTFTTACDAFGVPFSEGFEGTWPPVCWTNSGWVQSLYGAPHTGEEFAYSNLAGSELTTPEVAIPATGDYQLSFWYRAEGASYPQDMDVLISNDGGSTWTTLESFVGVASTTYAEAVYNLAAYAGQSIWVKFVGLTGTGGYDWGVLVDDVLIDMVPPPQQTLMLPVGWSGWSSYIDPAMDATFAEVIAPVAPYMDFGQFFGSVYWPAYGINTMGNFTNAHGYVAKMATAAELTLTGNMLAPGVLDLNSGWNLISVLSECDVDVTLLAGLPDFVICMEVAGTGVYWPAGALTSLTTLVPGKAYWVRMNAAASFTFPACAKDAGITHQLPLRPEHATPWNAVHYTGTTHFVAVSEEAGRSLVTGDVIGVFNAEGILTGMTEYQGKATTLNVFGDDVTTAAVDGMAEGSTLIFKVYRATTGEVFDVTVNYSMDMPDYTGTFTTLGMSRITGMTLNATGVGTLTSGVSIFPNPSTGIFNITMNGVSGNVDITVVDAHGQNVVNTHAMGNTVIDLTAQPRGIYYMKLVGSNFTRIEKVVVK